MSKKVTLTYKNLMEWTNLDPRLWAIFSQLVNMWPGDGIRITDIRRSRKQDRAVGGSGVHVAGPPYRAIDVGIRVLDANIREAQLKAEKICDLLNELWQYDPARPKKPVAYCKPHGTGPHIHLQTHPNTKRKSE
jgi:hypothetical protein